MNTKKALIKSVSLLLLLTITVAVGASCAKKEGENNNTEDNVYEKNGLGGYTLAILTSGDAPTTYASSAMVYTEEANGDTMREAMYERNSKVTKKYNFELSQEYAGDDTIGEVVKLIAAQDDAYQVIIDGNTVSYINQNLVTNIYDIPYLKLDEKYWRGADLDTLSVNGFAGAIMGYVIFDAFDSKLITMYNRPLADDYGIENLYTVTTEGGWTMERMKTEIEKVVTDLDNNGMYSLEDRIGLLYASNANPYFAGSGISFVKKDSKGEYYFDTSVVEKAEQVGDNMKAILTKKGNAADWLVAVDGITTIIGMIENKQVLFQNMLTSQVRRFYREIKTDFGLLPLPKYSEEQDVYYSNSGSPTIMVPISNTAIDKTGFALEALCAASAGFDDIYYHVCIESKYTRDEESIDMIMLSCNNTVCDPLSYYNFGNLSAALDSAIMKGRNIANLIPNFIDAVNVDIEELMIERVQTNAN